MKKLLACVLICFSMISFVQAQLKGTTYTIEKETTQAEFDKICKENPQITEINYYNTQPINLNNLNSISNLKELKTLYLKNIELNTPLDFSLLKNLVSLEKIFFQKIDLTNTEGFAHVSLNNLTLNECEINSLEFLNGTPNITRLVLEGSTLNKITDFSPINKLTKLKSLEIVNSSTPTSENLKALVGIQSLRKLTLFDLDMITNINFLKNFNNIKKLNVARCRKLSDISIINNFSNLRNLNISETNVTSIKGISSSSQTLERLFMEGCQVADISELKNAMSLYLLNLNNTKVSSLKDIEGLEKLSALDFKGTTITDLSPLTKCPAYRGGDFGDKVTDLSPLHNCESLVVVRFPIAFQSAMSQQIRELRNAKPSLKIDYYR